MDLTDDSNSSTAFVNRIQSMVDIEQPNFFQRLDVDPNLSVCVQLLVAHLPKLSRCSAALQLHHRLMDRFLGAPTLHMTTAQRSIRAMTLAQLAAHKTSSHIFDAMLLSCTDAKRQLPIRQRMCQTFDSYVREVRRLYLKITDITHLIGITVAQDTQWLLSTRTPLLWHL